MQDRSEMIVVPDEEHFDNLHQPSYSPIQHPAYKHFRNAYKYGWSSMVSVMKNNGAAEAGKVLNYVPYVFNLTEYIHQGKNFEEICYLLPRDILIDQGISGAGKAIFGAPFTLIKFGLNTTELLAKDLAPFHASLRSEIGQFEFPSSVGEFAYQAGTYGIYTHVDRIVKIGEAWGYVKPTLEKICEKTIEYSGKYFFQPLGDQLNYDLLHPEYDDIEIWMTGGETRLTQEPARVSLLPEEPNTQSSKNFFKFFGDFKLSSIFISPLRASEPSPNLPPMEQPVLLFSNHRSPLDDFGSANLTSNFSSRWVVGSFSNFHPTNFYFFYPSMGLPAQQALMFPGQELFSSPPVSFMQNQLDPLPIPASNANIASSLHLPLSSTRQQQISFAPPPLRDQAAFHMPNNVQISGHFNGKHDWRIQFEIILPLTKVGGAIGAVFGILLVGSFAILNWRKEKAYEKLKHDDKNNTKDYEDLMQKLNERRALAEQLLETQDVGLMHAFIAEQENQKNHVQGKIDKELKDRTKRVKKSNIKTDDKNERLAAYEQLRGVYNGTKAEHEILKAFVGISLGLKTRDENLTNTYVDKLPAEHQESVRLANNQYFTVLKKQDELEIGFTQLNHDYTAYTARSQSDASAIFQPDAENFAERYQMQADQYKNLITEARQASLIAPAVIEYLTTQWNAATQTYLSIEFALVPTPSTMLEIYQKIRTQFGELFQDKEKGVSAAVVQQSLKTLLETNDKLILSFKEQVAQQEDLIQKGLSDPEAGKILANNQDILKALQQDYVQFHCSEQHCQLIINFESLQLKVAALLKQATSQMSEFSHHSLDEKVEQVQQVNLHTEIVKLRQDIDNFFYMPGVTNEQTTQLLNVQIDIKKLENRVNFAEAIPLFLAGNITFDEHMKLLEVGLTGEQAFSNYMEAGNLFNELKRYDEAIVYYQKADPSLHPAAALSLADVYAHKNLLEEAIIELERHPDEFPEQLLILRAEYKVQFYSPIVNFASFVLENCIRKKREEWTFKDYTISGFLTLQNIFPHVLPTFIHQWNMSDPVTDKACANIISRPFSKLEEYDPKAWTLLTIRAVHELARWFPETFEHYNVVDYTSFAYNFYMAHDALTVFEPFAVAHFGGMLLAHLYQKKYYSKQQPETVAELIKLDLIGNLPRFIASWAMPASLSIRLVTLFCSALTVPYKYFFTDQYDEQARLGFEQNTHALVYQGNIATALDRYDSRREYASEKDLVLRASLNDELEEYKFSYENKPNATAVDARFARNLLTKKCCDPHFKRRPAKIQNHYLEHLRRISVLEAPQRRVLASTVAEQSISYQCYGQVLQSRYYFNTASVAFSNSFIKAEMAYNTAEFARPWYTKSWDWLKRTTGWGVQSSESYKVMLQQAKNIQQQNEVLAAQFSSGDYSKGFAAYFYEIYQARKESQLIDIDDETLAQEFELVIILSHLFAEKITFVMDESAREFNFDRICFTLLQISLRTKDANLRLLAQFLLKIVDRNEDYIEDHKEDNLTSDIDNFLNKIKNLTTYKQVSAQPFIAKFIMLYNENENAENTIFAVLSEEFFDQTPTGLRFKFVLDCEANKRKSLVEIYLEGLLTYRYLVTLAKNPANLRQMEQYCAGLLDGMLQRGFLPPFKKLIAKYFIENNFLNEQQVKLLFSLYGFDESTIWSAKTKFQLLTAIYTENHFVGDMSITEISNRFGNLVRRFPCTSLQRSFATLALQELIHSSNDEKEMVAQARTLLLHLADPNAPDNFGNYLLPTVVSKGWREATLLFCQYSVNVDQVDNRGYSALKLCGILFEKYPERVNLIEIAKILISYGADRSQLNSISKYDVWGFSALFFNQPRQNACNSLAQRLLRIQMPAAILYDEPFQGTTKKYRLVENRLRLEHLVSSADAPYDKGTISYFLKNYCQSSGNIIEPEYVPYSNLQYLPLIYLGKISATHLIFSQVGDEDWCVIYLPENKSALQPIIINTSVLSPINVHDFDPLLQGKKFIKYTPKKVIKAQDKSIWLIEMAKLVLATATGVTFNHPNEDLVYVKLQLHLPFLYRKQPKAEEAKVEIEEEKEESNSTASDLDRQKFVAAIKKRDLKEVVALYQEKKLDLNVPDEESQLLPLHLAVDAEDLFIAECLIDYKAEINAKAKDETPLMLAVKKKHYDMTYLLVRKGASLTPDEKSTLALTKLAYKSDPRIWQLVLNQKLILACSNKFTTSIDLLIEQKADVNHRNVNEEFKPYTAIGTALTSNQPAIVNALLEHKASPDVREIDGNTAVHLSAQTGNLSQLRQLLLYSPAINSQGENKRTPIGWAANNGHVEVVTFLIQQRADLTIKDDHLQTPLENAYAAKQQACIDVLEKFLKQELIDALWGNDTERMLQVLKSGINPSFIMHYSNVKTPLIFYAARKKYREALQLLLQFGADPNEKEQMGDWQGWSALAYLIYENEAENWPLIRLLLEHHASPDEIFIDRAWKGWSLLYYSAFQLNIVNFIEIFITLLERDASQNLLTTIPDRNYKGYYLIEYFILSIHTEYHKKAAETLLEYGCYPLRSQEGCGSQSLFLTGQNKYELYEVYFNKTNQRDSLYFWLKGNLFLYNKQYEEAIGNYQEILRLNPRNHFAHYWIGKVLFYQNKYAEALFYLNQAIKLCNTVPMFFMVRNIVHSKLGNEDAQLHDCTELTKLRPKGELSYNNRGAVLFGRNDFRVALDCFNKALENSPKCTMAHNNRGQALLKLGEFAEAEAAFFTSDNLGLLPQQIKQIQDKGRLWGKLAGFYARTKKHIAQKNWDEARKALEEAEKIATASIKHEWLQPLRQQISTQSVIAVPDAKSPPQATAKPITASITPRKQGLFSPNKTPHLVVGGFRGTLRNEKVHFNRVPNTGRNLLNPQPNSCGFIALGQTRQQVMQKLNAHLEDKEVQHYIMLQINNDYRLERTNPLYALSLKPENKVRLKKLYDAYIDCEEKLSYAIQQSKEFLKKNKKIEEKAETNLQDILNCYQEMKGHEGRTEELMLLNHNFRAAERRYAHFIESKEMVIDFLSNNILQDQMGVHVALAWAAAAKRTVRVWEERPAAAVNADNIYLLMGVENQSEEEEIDIIHTWNQTHYERLMRSNVVNIEQPRFVAS